MAKRSIVLLLVFAMLAVVLTGCGQATGGKRVGVTMPTKSLQRWNEDGANVKKALEAKGYKVDLQYADNKQETQNSQIENQITMGCDVLVILLSTAVRWAEFLTGKEKEHPRNRL